MGNCDTINFFDNIDGGASETFAIATLGIVYISNSCQQELISALTVVTAGATLGFFSGVKL